MERRITLRINLRRGLLTALALATLGSALAAPYAAYADGDKGKGKDGKQPIIIGKPIITPDPDPTPLPKKK